MISSSLKIIWRERWFGSIAISGQIPFKCSKCYHCKHRNYKALSDLTLSNIYSSRNNITVNNVWQCRKECTQFAERKSYKCVFHWTPNRFERARVFCLSFFLLVLCNAHGSLYINIRLSGIFQVEKINAHSR